VAADRRASDSAGRHPAARAAPQPAYFDLNEPMITHVVLGHKTPGITSRYASANAVLLAAADAVADVTTKLMNEDVDRGSE